MLKRVLPAASLMCAMLQLPCRADIFLPGEKLYPEAVTASRDGTLYVGTAKGVVRVTPGAPQVDSVPVAVAQIRSFAFDERGKLLWACASVAGEHPTLTVIDGRTGKLRHQFRLEHEGECADVTLGRDGTVYMLDSVNSVVLRLKRGEEVLTPWLSNDDPLRSAGNWSALSADNMGGIYLMSRDKGSLMRVPVRWDGSAGNLSEIRLDRPLNKPIALKPMAKRKLLVTEASGELTMVSVLGLTGSLSTLASTIAGPGNLAIVDGVAYVAESQARVPDGGKPRQFRLVSVDLPKL